MQMSLPNSVLPPDGNHAPEELAELAQLRYVRNDSPGFTRKRRGKGFAYFDTKGEPIVDGAHHARIEALVIPPAWTEVWICPFANGHLQATGRDDRNRKQYLYHERWRELSNETKFHRMIAFGTVLPRIRRQVERDLRRRKLDLHKVVAAVVAVMDRASIRIGNREYAEVNESFGLTTMKDHHVEIEGSKISFQFRGKGGKEQNVEFRDRRLAKVIASCEEIPGQELFQYVNGDGEYRTIGSSDVNKYLQEATGQDFTAKDFRTWRGTVLATSMICTAEDASTQREAKKVITAAIRHASEALGNTMTVCRKYYVHPQILELYASGKFCEMQKKFRQRHNAHMEGDEQFLLYLLRKIARDSRPATSKKCA